MARRRRGDLLPVPRGAHRAALVRDDAPAVASPLAPAGPSARARPRGGGAPARRRRPAQAAAHRVLGDRARRAPRRLALGRAPRGGRIAERGSRGRGLWHGRAPGDGQHPARRTGRRGRRARRDAAPRRHDDRDRRRRRAALPGRRPMGAARRGRPPGPFRDAIGDKEASRAAVDRATVASDRPVTQTAPAAPRALPSWTATLLLAGAWLAVGPATPDLAAQVYRAALFAAHGSPSGTTAGTGGIPSPDTRCSSPPSAPSSASG